MNRSNVDCRSCRGMYPLVECKVCRDREANEAAFIAAGVVAYAMAGLKALLDMAAVERLEAWKLKRQRDQAFYEQCMLEEPFYDDEDYY